MKKLKIRLFIAVLIMIYLLGSKLCINTNKKPNSIDLDINRSMAKMIKKNT